MKLTLNLEKQIRSFNTKPLLDKVVQTINMKRAGEFFLTGYEVKVEGNEILITKNQVEPLKNHFNESKTLLGSKPLISEKSLYSSRMYKESESKKLDRMVKQSIDFVLKNPSF